MTGSRISGHAHVLPHIVFPSSLIKGDFMICQMRMSPAFPFFAAIKKLFFEQDMLYVTLIMIFYNCELESLQDNAFTAQFGV
jgi:hypothetical protein